MKNEKQIRCPFCRSDQVLPHEEENRQPPHTMPVIFFSAFLILGFYFLFLLLSTLSFPIMVIILVALFSFYLRVKEKGRKKIKNLEEKNFMCLDCGRDFSHQIPEN